MKKLRTYTAVLLSAISAASLLTGCSAVPQNTGTADTAPLPAYFNLIDEGRIGRPGRQHETGMCWSYLCTAVAESSILTDGLIDAEHLNLSEAHLCYFMYQRKDEMTDESRDGFYIPEGWPTDVKVPYHAGGDSEVALGMYANGCGLADEAFLPEFSSESLKAQKSFKSLYDGAHSGAITEFDGDWLLVGRNDRIGRSAEEIKRAIMNEGAIGAGILASGKGVSKADDGTRAYFYCTDAETFGEGSHAVALIGWDDNYSKEHFFSKHRPENDGAWIARDSTDLLSGEDGLMYISYEEYIMSTSTVDMCRRSDYGDVLHYDVYCKETVCGEDGSTTVANVFTARRDCALKGVGVYTAADNQPIEITVFKNPEPGNPGSGRRAAKLKTVVPCAGYHVVDLKKQCKFSGGDSFSIIVSYKGGEAFVEGTELTEYCRPFIDMYVTSGKGESFIKSGDEWLDTSDEATAKVFGKDNKLNNVGIRALLAPD